MAAGTYTYYLFALDNISNPTLVGPGANPGFWATGRVDTRQDPPRSGPRSLPAPGDSPRRYGHRLYSKSRSLGKFPDPWMNERRGVSPEFWDISFYEVDPTESNVGFIGNKGQFDAARPSGVWARQLRPGQRHLVAGRILVRRRQGFVQLENRVSDSAVSKAFHHSWVADDGLIYVGITDREAPMTPRVVGIDALPARLPLCWI